MKKIAILLIVIYPIFTSCENDKIEKLQTKISELENENAELKKTIENKQIEKLKSSYFMTTLFSDHLTVDKEEKIKISMVTMDTIPEFNVYSIEKDKRKLIMENLNTSEFYYSFTPSSIEDNQIDLTVKFELPIGNVEYQIKSIFDIREK